MRLRGAIFDVDGTLLDSMPIWDTFAVDYLHSVGCVPKPGLREAVWTMSFEETAVYFRTEYGLQEPAEAIVDGLNRQIVTSYAEKVPPKADIRPFLERLRAAGVRMCVATATYRYMVEAGLRHCGLLAYFDRIFTCGELATTKRSPLIYETALAHLGTAKAETPVFEDALYAARTAKDAGFPVVAIRDASAAGDEAALRALADAYIERYSQLAIESV